LAAGLAGGLAGFGLTGAGLFAAGFAGFGFAAGLSAGAIASGLTVTWAQLEQVPKARTADAKRAVESFVMGVL
jgi:hypothetical protein